MSIDLTTYLSDDLELTIGQWTIKIPLPNVRQGKILEAMNKSILDAQKEIDRKKNTTDAQRAAIVEKHYKKNGVDPNLDTHTFMLGEQQVNELIEQDVPEQVLTIAATYAMNRWMSGSDEMAREVLNEIFGSSEAEEVKKAHKP